jgi:hypothetical protein
VPSKTLFWKPEIPWREEILPKSRGWCGIPNCGSYLFYRFRSTSTTIMMMMMMIIL